MALPSFTRSLRFRLSGITAAVAFGIGALVLGVTYLAVLSRVRSSTVRALVITRQPVEVNGQTVLLPQWTEQELRTVESVLKEMILNQVALIALVVVVGLFLVSLAVGWFVAGRALRPVDRITAVAREIEATDLSRRIGLEGPDDELTRMADTFDSMLDRLDRAFTTQRTMLAQTSHDLRTPLAVIRSNLDVTLSDPEATVEEWRSTGEIVSRATERMSSMIDQLLATARLVAGRARLVNVDLGRVAAEVGQDVDARARAVGRSLSVEDQTAIVEGDPTALARALGNLVDNAIRHSPDGSGVTIASGSRVGWGYLAVADRGSGVDPSVVRGETPSPGLGLGIVRDVAHAHHGRVDAALRPGGGSLVVIWIPEPDARGKTPETGSLPYL